MADSILSDRTDGFGFYYGHRVGDHRQINVRLEQEDPTMPGRYKWMVYVGGDKIGSAMNKEAAELVAIGYMDEHPVEKDDAA